jgi:hypothetical protein
MLTIRAAFEFFFDGKSRETFSGRKRTFARRIAGPPKFLADLLWLALEGTQVLFDQLPNRNTKNLAGLAIGFQKVVYSSTPGTEPPDFPVTFSGIRPERTGGQLPGRQLADSANLLGCHQFQFAERIQPAMAPRFHQPGAGAESQ